VVTHNFLHGLIQEGQCDGELTALWREGFQQEQETEYCKKIVNVSSCFGRSSCPPHNLCQYRTHKKMQVWAKQSRDLCFV